MYFCICSNNNNDASTLLYKGLLSNPEYPFGTRPYLIFFFFFYKTSFAISNRFGIKSSPSKEINASLPQSKNHGYPAIKVCKLKEGLYTKKLSVAIK